MLRRFGAGLRADVRESRRPSSASHCPMGTALNCTTRTARTPRHTSFCCTASRARHARITLAESCRKHTSAVGARVCSCFEVVAQRQMSRVDSVKIGAMRAQLPIEQSVMASDAFFPFRDGIDEAAKHDITAVIQPGGSVRDDEVIAAANENGLAMVFTGVRHFRH